MTDIFRGIPQELITANRMDPYSLNSTTFAPLKGYRAKNTVTNIPVELVRQMPPDTYATYEVQAEEMTVLAQIQKGHSIPFESSLRIVGMDPRFYLEAHILRLRVLMGFIGLSGGDYSYFADVPTEAKLIKFALQTVVEDRHTLAFRARSFIPWALEVFRDSRPTWLLAEWEPTSVNYDAFYKALRVNGGNKISAAKETWTHNQFTHLGFRLMPKIGITPIHPDIVARERSNLSPFGHPPTIIHALYSR